MSNRRYDLNDNPSNRILGAKPELDFVYTPMASVDASPLRARLLYVTAAKYEGDWHSIAHAHAFSELFFILGGQGQFLANGQLHQVEADDLVIINPQVEHTELSLEAKPLEYIVLGIEGLQFAGKSGASDSFAAIRIARASPKIRQYMTLLLEEVQQDHPGHDLVCQNLLNIILVLILSHKQVEISICASRNISSECAAVKHFIDANFRDQLTLEDLAQAAHQNKYYVAHAFKETFGIAPIRYLTERRVDESKCLLRDTDYPVGQISSMAGFSSLSVFSQTFKRLAGLSPNEYRKQVTAQKGRD